MITENGTFTVPNGKTGFNSFEVSVVGSSRIDLNMIIFVNRDENERGYDVMLGREIFVYNENMYEYTYSSRNSGLVVNICKINGDYKLYFCQIEYGESTTILADSYFAVDCWQDFNRICLGVFNGESYVDYYENNTGFEKMIDFYINSSSNSGEISLKSTKFNLFELEFNE